MGQRFLTITIASTMALAAACSEPEPELTAADFLSEIEGRELTPAEVAEKEEIAQLLCGIDDSVLTVMWSKMDKPQLEFQDWVFGQVCRDRSEIYATATGRFTADSSSSSTTEPDEKAPVDRTGNQTPKTAPDS